MQEGEDMPDFEDEGGLFLVLNISTLNSGSSGTRATKPDYLEQPVLNTEKMNSLRVIIVDVQEGSETKDKVIFNEHAFLNYTLGITGWRYKINFETEYNVYLIANEEGLSTHIQNQLKNLIPESNYAKNTLEDIVISNSVDIEAGSAFISNDPTYLTGGQGIKPIPMTEMFVVEPISRPTDTNSSAEEIKVEVKKDMFVTRMASKFTFRFFKSEDYIPTGSINGLVKSVKISGLRKEEYLIPRATYADVESSNGIKGKEITNFEIPSQDNTIGDYVFTLPGGGINVATLGSNGSTYSPAIYFPDSPVGQYNKLTCTISFGEEEYEVPVEFDNLPYGLPRNTHAIVNINVGKNGKFNVTFEIEPWTREELTLDYTATPNVTQKLIWTGNTYESYDENTGVVVVKPASTVESIVPVKGTFVLNTPKGATWHAFLIPSTANGNPYAFQFKDKDNYTSSLSGTVDPGKIIEIEIYPRIVDPEENNEALLQIVVTLGNGNVIEVPVTPDGMTYKNFTILQNKQ